MRMIDADALINHFQKEWDGCEISNATWIWLREVLRDQPTIDAVPVVRCGECEHTLYESTSGRSVICNYCTAGMLHERPKNWFCADGERRES